MRLLDLFCGEGGAAAGYAAAGWEVVGVDVRKVGHRYPFEFHLADAVEFAKEHAHEFDAVHASPPCQTHSKSAFAHGADHPDHLDATRLALINSGRPYVIENVPGAPLVNPITLCGAAFRLTATDRDGEPLFLKRHRLFESNVWLTPTECECAYLRDNGFRVAGVYGGRSHKKANLGNGGYTPDKPIAAVLMRVGWMTRHGLEQAIPPAYAEYIGTELAERLDTFEASA